MNYPHPDCAVCLKWSGVCDDGRNPEKLNPFHHCFACVTAPTPAPEEAKTLPLFGGDLMAKIYLACPYSHNPMRGFVESSKAAARLMDAGNIVFSPISHSHPVAVHGKLDAMDQAFCLRQDLP